MPAEGSSSDVPPAAFGRYRVLHQLGAGSLGPVFRGEDSATGRSVLITAIDSNLTPEQARALAVGFGELASRLPSHPALAPILDAGVQDAAPYYVTPAVPGDSLDAALEQYGPAAIVDALPRLALLAAALDEANEAGIWHGMLQPRDILVSTEDTTLVGLGVAQWLHHVGVPLAFKAPYASPDVLAGATPNHAADQFALAAIAHEWLFGRRVAGPASAMVALPSLPGVDGEMLSSAFTTALAPRPSDRFATTGEFVAALSASLHGSRKRVVSGARTGEYQQSADFALPDLDLDNDAPPIDEHPSRDPVMWQGIQSSEGPGVRGSEVPALLGSEVPAFEPATSPSRSFGSGAILATLIVGLGLGMSIGYWVGSSQTKVETGATVRPTAQEYTDSALSKPVPDAAQADRAIRPADAPSTAEPVAPAAPAPRTNVAPDRAARREPAAPTRAEPDAPIKTRPTTGSLVVESRPAGARIVIDGRAVGVTPLVVPSLTTGTHTVSLDRSGYRPWTTRVQITEGARARVAASLVGGKAQE